MAHEERFMDGVEAWFTKPTEDLLVIVERDFGEMDASFKEAVVRVFTFERMWEIYLRKGMPYLEQVIRALLPHVSLRKKKDLMLVWKRVSNKVNKGGRSRPSITQPE